MSDKQLHEVLAKGDKDSCLAFFQGMSEKMRRKLAPQCQSWFRKVRKNSAPSGPMEAAAIAVFATCNATEIKSLG